VIGLSSKSEAVSVVIPCYNAAAFLGEALDSVFAQTHAPAEVIVVDDGSTDQSAAIAESYGPPLRLIRQENQKEGKTRNRGIDESRGAWIAFLDADDVWRPNKLEKQLQAVAPDVVAVHSDWYGFGTKDFVTDFSQWPPEERYSVSQFLLGGLQLNMSNLMVRADTNVRFQDWTVDGSPDTVYYLDISKTGRIAYVPEVLSGTRFHPASHSAAPGVLARHHQSYEGWLSRHEDELDPPLVAAIREGMIDRLVQDTWNSFWKREWENFHTLRSYLRRYADRPEVSRLLAKRILPRWVYRMKDRYDRTRRGHSHPA